MSNTTPLTKKEKELAKSWKSRTLPVILHLPDAYNKENKKRIKQADENKLIIKYTGSSIVAMCGCAFMFLFIIFWGLGDKDVDKYFGLGAGAIGIPLLLYYFTMPRKYWVFNRKTQIVTVPGRHYTKGHEIPLDKMRIKTWMTMSNAGVASVFPVAVVPSSKFEEFTGTNIASLETLNQAGDLYKLWSYYVWYMDENRPLPPGKIFDHCREREFKDRKKRGFPLPLYYSLVPTPEATPEFQKQRDEKWTDEMFCPDVNKYGECSLEPGKEKFPDNSVWYRKTNNPENWEWHKFKDPSGFKYKPEIDWLRFVFDNGKVVYSLNLLQNAMFPPEGNSYKTEYIRKNYIDIRPYFEKELKELREKEGKEA